MVYCHRNSMFMGIDMEKKEKIARAERLYRIFFLCFALCNLVGVGINLSFSIFSESLETLRHLFVSLMLFFLAADIVLFVLSMVFLARSRRLKKTEEREKKESEQDDSDGKFESK